MRSKLELNIKNIIIVTLVLLSIISSLYALISHLNKEEKEPKMYIRNLINSYKVLKIDNREINYKAEYPFFNYDILDNEIKNIISDKPNTSITYEISYFNQIYNILFTIKQNDKNTYKNVLLDLQNEKIIDKNVIYNFDIAGNEILERIKNKYSTAIYNRVLLDGFKHASVNIEQRGIKVLFDDNLFNVDYEVYLFLGEEKETAGDSYDKVIAFTFDDGPGDYTKDIVNTLKENASSATFFELGSKMKSNQEIVKYLIDNNMEVGSHTYSHKNLNSATLKTIEEEINSTNIIYNEITDKDVPLTRTPYGNAINKVKSIINTPIIQWNIDTKDWLYRDANKIAKHILDNAQDGDIILMHDIYPETLEAIRISLPELNSRGFKVTSVSNLAKEKNISLEVHEVYSSFK